MPYQDILFQYLIDSTLCWTAFLLIYVLFLQKETFFRYNRLYLLSSMMLGLLMPLLRLLPKQVKIEHTEPLEYAAYWVGESLILPEVSKGNDIYIMAILTLYSIGILVSIYFIVRSILSIYKLREGADIEQKHGYELIKTEKEHLPFSFFGSVYISKKLSLDTGVDQILKHEIAHVNGRHSWDILAVEIIKCLFWFHPLLYIYKSALRQTHEFVADQMVCKEYRRKDYGRLLLEHSFSGLQMSLANHFFNSHLKKRIQMMYQHPSQKKASIKYLMALPLVLLFFVVFNIAYPDMALANEDRNALNELIKNHPYDNHCVALNNKDNEPKVVINYSTGDDCNAYEEILIGDTLHIYCYDDSTYELLKSEHYAERLNSWSSHLEHGTIELDTVPSSSAEFDTIVEFDAETYEERLTIVEREPQQYSGDSISYIVKDGKSEMKVYNEGEVDTIIEFDLDTKREKTSIVKRSFPNQNDEVFKVVERMPCMIGCETITDKEERTECSNKKFVQYLGENIKYPKKAQQDGTEGTVVATFIIDKSGFVQDVKIVRKISNEIDAESLRVLNAMNGSTPSWSPGRQRGKAVKVLYTVPIKYKLQDDKKSKSEIEKKLEGKKAGFGWQSKGVYQDSPTVVAHGDAKEIKLFDKNIDQDNITYIIDGVIEQPNSLTTINPDDIATINVYKGAKAKEIYGDGIKESVIDIKTKVYAAQQDPEFDIPAMVPGCEKEGDTEAQVKCSEMKLLMAVYKNIKYPAEARDRSIQGTVISSFTVEADGRAHSPVIKESIEGGCAEAVMDMYKIILKKYPTWIPAKKDGKAIKSEYVLPVKFKLE